MTLTTRLSFFFLATLAVVLAGFSAALYFLAGMHLQQQVEERLESTLNTLSAAVELSPEGMEWEPAQRHLNLGRAFGDQVVWLVSDKDGHIIDGSKQAGGADFLTGIAAALPLTRRSSERVNWNEQPWQCGRRWLSSRSFGGG